jgi:hypothetical protein
MDKKLVDIAAELRHETKPDFKDQGAYLLHDGRVDSKGKDICEWVPKSMVEDNGDGTFTMPEFLAMDKGFI